MSQFRSGVPAAPNVLRSGTAVILLVPVLPNTTSSIFVADTNITATSVIVCWGFSPLNATATTFSIDNINVGVGFTVVSNAAVTVANKTVGWAILKY